MEQSVDLIAGRLNRGTETLYWKMEKMMSCKLGDYAIVENANGYDLVKICGFITTMQSQASYFSKTKYENMKKVIMIMDEEIIEKKEE